MTIREDIRPDVTADASAVVRQQTHPHRPVATNNFDAIRLGAALLVLYSHQFVFLGKAQPSPTGNSLGEVAVTMFFVISGYLVAESWYRDPHIVRFALRRLLRLWPGLALATIAIALACATITTLAWLDYWNSGARHFAARNLLLRPIYELPGVFAGHPGNRSLSAVNGSWWTIPLEAKCYVYLAALGLIGLRRRWFSVLALAVVGFQYFRSLPGPLEAQDHQNLTSFYIAFFMTGVCARQFRAELFRFRLVALGLALAILALALATRHEGLSQWIVIAPATLVAGSLDTAGFRSAGRFGDLSYGIYLYAYFVQQLVIEFWPGSPTLVGSLLVSAIVTTVLAWCSWHLVEAPALRLKRQLRRWFPDQAA